MKKFKILSWILKLFICIYILGSLANGYAIHILYDNSIPSVSPNVIFHFASSILLALILTIGFYFIQQSCAMFIQRGYFNSKSALYLTRGGYIIAATAILSFILLLTKLEIPVETKSIANIITNVGYNTMLLIVGFALVAVSDIIKKGESIKLENDLTI